MDNILKINDLKVTKQRELVLKVIEELKDKATNKNISKLCSNSVNNSTVYRIIDLFLEKNIIDKGLNYDNNIYYYIKKEHSHFITCIKCLEREEIDLCPLYNLCDDLKNKGYDVINHQVHIDALCNKCKKQEK